MKERWFVGVAVVLACLLAAIGWTYYTQAERQRMDAAVERVGAATDDLSQANDAAEAILEKARK